MAIAMGIAVSVASIGALAVYGSGDDEEKIQLANKNPEDLSRYIFLPGSVMGLGSGLVKIRIPEIMGAPAALAQLYFGHLFMNNSVSLKDIYKSQETVLPSQIQLSKGFGVLGSWLPQGISPSLQVLTNTRFYPSMMPIVPDWMEDLDEYAQYDKYTSRTAKALGDLTRDNIELSPKKIDFFVRAQGGRAVSLIQNLAESSLYGDPVKTYINIFEESDRFLFTGRIYNKFYEMRDEAKSELKALNSHDHIYIVSDEILDNVKEKVGEYDQIDREISQMRDIMNNGGTVPVESQRSIFRRLQEITKDEL